MENDKGVNFVIELPNGSPSSVGSRRFTTLPSLGGHLGLTRKISLLSQSTNGVLLGCSQNYAIFYYNKSWFERGIAFLDARTLMYAPALWQAPAIISQNFLSLRRRVMQLYVH